MAPLSLSLIEIAVLMVGAITLGFTIHFFISSRRNFTTSPIQTDKISKSLEEWKLRYFNDMEIRDKELSDLRRKAADDKDNNEIYAVEMDELRRQNKKLLAEISSIRNIIPSGDKQAYIEQLRQAQSGLVEQNEKINQILDQIDLVKETESKQEEIKKYNEELTDEVDDLKFMLSEKEKELESIREKALLTREMASRLDNAYNEFTVLQEKIKKLESQVLASQKLHLEYEDLKESNYKITRDYEEIKQKYHASMVETQQLQGDHSETEDKLREANFQCQQLQKRVAYLEELNHDMQTMAEANQKLESQFRRIGELESMLNVMTEGKKSK